MQPDRSAIDAVRRQFYEDGKSVSDWAREHGFDRGLVYSVLNGRCLARRGASHRIAVALGLKKGDRGGDPEAPSAAGRSMNHPVTDSKEASMTT
jgi:gp16 family phage-associated protein